MKLVNAKIFNFRLLDGIEMKFATDPEKNLTVIRAANESGKTTLLMALQWGLFGDEALPSNYVLRPMDAEQGKAIETKVQIEYEIENRLGPQRYLLERSVVSERTGALLKKSDLFLFHVESSGYKPEPAPYNHVQQHIPGELREVFFTDGDRALSFIEGPRAEQQQKVRSAIEKMMGLSLLETTIDHVRSNEKKLRAQYDQEAGDAETKIVERQLEDLERQVPTLEEQLAKIVDQTANVAEMHQKADRDLQDALRQGNRDELARELQDTKAQNERMEKAKRQAETNQSLLLSSQILAQHLMAVPFAKAGALLDDLRHKGKIPNKTIPILEDRLAQTICICGESLEETTSDGKRRRDHIRHLIDESRDADNLKAKISDLYFQAKPLFAKNVASWTEQYNNLFGERQNIQMVCTQIANAEAELLAKISKIPNVDIQRLREIRDRYADEIRQLTIEGTKIDQAVKQKKRDKTDLEQKFRVLSARNQKGEKIARELLVAGDIRSIVERALGRMKTLEVQRVSAQMNALFLGMIGADESSALITKAEITPEFRIVVYGRGGQLLDPSLDLNGASRRALTIAFVLALAEISGVEAPNIIDTPLGMMSGYVKTEAVNIAARTSSQLVLLLTHDEIKGCEDILDRFCSSAMTITNPAHYPKILKNNPGTTAVGVLTCSCDYRSSCSRCERHENSLVAERVRA